MISDRLFVERRPEGDYAVRRPNADRASAVLPTQAEAIEKARDLNPNIAPLVERVRRTSVGKPDQWRKP
jgi:pyridoxine/pyridoxamine 5'-phosphate oxidase